MTMTNERLREICKALFDYVVSECFDIEGEVEIMDTLGIKYDEYKEMGGKLTLKEMADVEMGVDSDE